MDTTVRTIIVATDFSENAQHALKWAIALGQQHAARIVLVHAIEPAGAGLEAIDGSLLEASRSRLSESESTIQRAKLQSASEIRRGRPWKVVAEVAARQAADLIVMGTRGRTGYKRVLLGSAADRLIRMAQVPVIVVHPDDAIPAAGLHTVLVAVDFSEESAIVTNMAVRLVGGTRARSAGQPPSKLVLLHAVELMVEWPTPEVPDVLPRHWDDEETAAKRRLESLAASLRTEGLSVEARTVRGYPPEVIEEQARATQPDLIALGTRGQSGLAGWMIGSVTSSVLPHVPYPVLTARRAVQDDPS